MRSKALRQFKGSNTLNKSRATTTMACCEILHIFAISLFAAYPLSVTAQTTCSNNPCLFGTCEDQVGHPAFRCVCVDGVEGTFCEINIDECESNPCQNGGECVNIIPGYSCLCLPGWEGVHCQNQTGICLREPCQNGGNCTALSTSNDTYVCSCLSNWRGTNCTEDVNECSLGTQCLNGGTCRNTDGSFVCDCFPGFAGKFCEQDINECVSTPCLNDATCNNRNNKYTCTCSPGWIGVNCQLDLNECLSFPCQNGGICTDKVNGYNCTCPPGYTGNVCDININARNEIPWKIIAIVAIVTVIVITGIVGVLAVFIYRRKNNTRDNDTPKNNATHHYEEPVFTKEETSYASLEGFQQSKYETLILKDNTGDERRGTSSIEQPIAIVDNV